MDTMRNNMTIMADQPCNVHLSKHHVELPHKKKPTRWINHDRIFGSGLSALDVRTMLRHESTKLDTRAIDADGIFFMSETCGQLLTEVARTKSVQEGFRPASQGATFNMSQWSEDRKTLVQSQHKL
eukprot:2404871-Amphidinium_carterae.1